MEVSLEDTTLRIPLITMCDASSPAALNLSSVNDSFMLMSPNYPSAYPRGKNCSLNLTLRSSMQMHIALVDLDLVSSGTRPPQWQQQLLDYLSYSHSASASSSASASAQENASDAYLLHIQTRNCSREPDLFRLTASRFATSLINVQVHDHTSDCNDTMCEELVIVIYVLLVLFSSLFFSSLFFLLTSALFESTLPAISPIESIKYLQYTLQSTLSTVFYCALCKGYLL
jgi:hypothetical protein